eukprot:403333854
MADRSNNQNQSQNSNPDQLVEVWARLNSLNKKFKSKEIKEANFSIGRLPKSEMQIKDQRLSGTHCIINRMIDENGKMIVCLEDTSSNGTYHNGVLVGKGSTRELKNGDEIIMLKECEGVSTEDEIGFIFVVLKDYSKVEQQPNSQSQQDQLQQQQQAQQEQLELQMQQSRIEMEQSKEELGKRQKEEQEMKAKISMMADQFDCGICYMTMHQAVTLMPCLHTFCGGCFSDWLSRQKDCPSCRDSVVEVKKNSLVNCLIENYLILNPQQKRSEDEIKDLEGKNIFKNDTIKIETLGDVKQLQLQQQNLANPPAAVPIVVQQQIQVKVSPQVVRKGLRKQNSKKVEEDIKMKDEIEDSSDSESSNEGSSSNDSENEDIQEVPKPLGRGNLARNQANKAKPKKAAPKTKPIRKLPPSILAKANKGKAKK